MSEQEKPEQEVPEQLTDILLVLDQEKMKIVGQKPISTHFALSHRTPIVISF